MTAFVGNQNVTAEAVNISTSGILLKLPLSVECAGFIRLNFELAGQGVWIDADAVVTRNAGGEDSRMCGVAFVQLPEPAARALMGWVRSERREARVRASQAIIKLPPTKAEAQAEPQKPTEGATTFRSSRISIPDIDVKSLYAEALDDFDRD